MKNILYFSVIASLALSTTSCGDNRKAKNFNQKTLVDDMGLAFVKKATEAGATEIKAATVAEQRSQNPRVLAFAKMMITDHTTAGNELKQIADEKYVSYSDSLSQEHQQMIDSMSQLSGLAFDKAYMNMMVMDHGKVIELFKDAGRNTNKAINKYANKTVPKLQEHLDSAKAINASLK